MGDEPHDLNLFARRMARRRSRGAAIARRPGRPSRGVFALTATAVASLHLVGCRTYEPAPIEVSALREAFLARTPDAPEVASFAAALAAPEGDGAMEDSFDPSDGIDLAEAEPIALFLNPRLRERRAAAGVAEANAENAGLWPDPVVGLEFTRIIDSTVEPNELFGSVAFTIPISGRLEVEKERLGRAHAAELLRVAAMEWEVVSALRAAWSEWTAHRVLLEEATAFRAQIDSLLEVVDAMESLGELSRVEGRLFRLERAKIDARLERLASLVEESRLAVLRIMGLPPASDAVLLLGGWTTLPSDAEVAESDPSDAALAASPAVAIALAEHEVAEKALEQEIRTQIPDLGVIPGYGTQDGLEQFTLGLALPIPIFNGNRQAIEAAFAARELARIAVARAVEEILADLAIARVDIRSIARERAIVERDLVPLVDLQYAEARELARLGEVDTLILLDSLKQQHEAKVRLVEVRRDEVLAVVDLQALIGPPVAQTRDPESAVDPTAPASSGGTSDLDPVLPTTSQPTTTDSPERPS